MRKKLLESISLQLNEIFDNAIIYTENVKQNFQKGSFFIRILKESEKIYLSNRIKLFNKIEITYFPKVEDIEEINFIKEKLFENMKKLKYEKSFILAENIEAEIKDNKLKFYIDYNFYIFRFNDCDKMKSLFFKGDINEQ